MKDPTIEEDNIPMFADAATPLAQDAILDAITRDLSRTGTRLVYVMATNSLDSLFLTRVLSRECPDVRVVVDFPHQLFAAAAAREPLGGTLFLSTYPMDFAAHRWLYSSELDQNSNLMLEAADIQGAFNAVQFLVGDLHASEKLYLRDYAQLNRNNAAYPSMWLLTLDRSGFWPVDRFDVVDYERHSKGSSTLAVEDWFRKARLWPIRSWATTVWALCVLTLLGCWRLWKCNREKPGPAWPLWLYMGHEDFSWRRFALLGWAALSACTLILVLVLPGWRCILGRSRPDLIQCTATFVLSSLALVCPFVCLARILRHRPWKSGQQECAVESEDSPEGRRAELLLVLVQFVGPGVVLLLSIVVVWFVRCFDTCPAGLFFCYRALDLFSGSSPVPPVALLAGIQFVVALSLFKRHTLTGKGRPLLHLESSTLNKAAPDRFGRYLEDLRVDCEALHRRFRGVGASSTFGLLGLVLLFALGLAIAFFVLSDSTFSLELGYYNLVVKWGVVLCLFWLAVTCLDLLAAGRRLNQLLHKIEFIPLMPAIQRVSKDWPRRPLWAWRNTVAEQSTGRQMTLALGARRSLVKKHLADLNQSAGFCLENTTVEARGAQLDSILRQTEKLLNLLIPHGNQVDSQDQIVLGVNQQPKDPVPAPHTGQSPHPTQNELDEMHELREREARISIQILEYDLLPIWQESPGVVERSTPEENEKPIDAFKRHCADFVALHFCQYIAYAVEQVRRMAICISFCFLLLVLCLNSYNPQGPQVIARLLAALFIVIGIALVPVFARLDRNAILSKITHTTAGKLSSDFWIHLVTLGGLPFLGVLGHLFPEVSSVISRWVAPSIESIH